VQSAIHIVDARERENVHSVPENGVTRVPLLAAALQKSEPFVSDPPPEDCDSVGATPVGGEKKRPGYAGRRGGQDMD
jgi:hypothetical protein